LSERVKKRFEFHARKEYPSEKRKIPESFMVFFVEECYPDAIEEFRRTMRKQGIEFAWPLLPAFKEQDIEKIVDVLRKSA
jgi:hypothetical protein